MLHRNAVVPHALFALLLSLSVGCGVGQGELQQDAAAGTGDDPMEGDRPTPDLSSREIPSSRGTCWRMGSAATTSVRAG